MFNTKHLIGIILHQVFTTHFMISQWNNSSYWKQKFYDHIVCRYSCIVIVMLASKNFTLSKTFDDTG